MVIDIQELFTHYNVGFVYDSLPAFKRVYDAIAADNAGPEACSHCGHCEAICPKRLPIMRYLEELASPAQTIV